MPFDTGNVSFTICRLPQALPDDALQRFAGKRALSLDAVKDEPQTGWVSGRHLLETRIDDETAFGGGHFHLHLRTAQRKVPASLFRAQCRMEELARQQERKSNFLNRKERQEIRAAVTEKLLPQMPPTIGGIPFVAPPHGDVLYLGATSKAQIESFMLYFFDTIGFEPLPLNPELAAAVLHKKNTTLLAPLAFTQTPTAADEESQTGPGRDFCTWLWYFQEELGGRVKHWQFGEFALMIDGPLVFASSSPEGGETVVRKGTPTLSTEASAALASGKKLKRAKFTLARDQEAWVFTLDADTFTFRGVKLPAGEQLDPQSYFQERVHFLGMLREVFFQLYGEFLEQVSEAGPRRQLEPRLLSWAASLGTRE